MNLYHMYHGALDVTPLMAGVSCYVEPGMPLAPGTSIGSNLRLVRLLAEGGMGSVWIADHLGLKTQVAVKFIAESVAQDPTAMMRFEREATAAAHIKSPHVVQIFDHGMAEGRIPYIVMELLDGESLGRRLDRVGALNVRETAAVVSQVCRALSKAHASGVVHRDIKPDNIFLTDSDGELFVKVLDFGIAKRQADPSIGVTSTGMAVGTPLYMSPEQSVSAKDVTLATDLWAVAAVAYRCLTGRVPFQGDTFGALCVAINRGQFPPPSTLRQGIPAALDAWFARALAIVPAARFVSARELADQFSAAGGFPAGVQVSAPSALPARSSAPHAAAPRVDAPGGDARHADVAHAAARPPRSAQTVTVHPSDAYEGPRDARDGVATVQTGASIAGASLNGPSRAPAGARFGVTTKLAAIAALSAMSVGAALLLALSPSSDVTREIGIAGQGMTAAATEQKVPGPNLGASGGATVRNATNSSPSASAPGSASAGVPAAVADPAKEPSESHRKQGPSPSSGQGSSSGGVKAPIKTRSRPAPSVDPHRDLMEP